GRERAVVRVAGVVRLPVVRGGGGRRERVAERRRVSGDRAVAADAGALRALVVAVEREGDVPRRVEGVVERRRVADRGGRAGRQGGRRARLRGDRRRGLVRDELLVRVGAAGREAVVVAVTRV